MGSIQRIKGEKPWTGEIFLNSAFSSTKKVSEHRHQEKVTNWTTHFSYDLRMPVAIVKVLIGVAVIGGVIFGVGWGVQNFFQKILLPWINANQLTAFGWLFGSFVITIILNAVLVNTLNHYRKQKFDWPMLSFFVLMMSVYIVPSIWHYM